MHALEKILLHHSNKESIAQGDIITCEVDIAEINDLYLQVIKSFYEMGGKKVRNPDKVAFVLDHYAPAPTIQSADIQKKMRNFAREQDIQYFFDINKGVCHQVMPEEGIVWPGMLLVATDSHTTTHGAFGAFGTGVGATDLAVILLEGELWFRVPEIIRINIMGELGKGLMAKDVILNIIGELKQDVAVYKAIEYAGSTVEALDMAGRMVLCNMAVEMGAKTSYIQPDKKTLNFIDKKTDRSYRVFETDPGFNYSQEFDFDVSGLAPQVAVPHSIDSVKSIEELQENIPVDQVLIGTCTGGRIEDIKIAAEILENKTVSPDCRLIITPASTRVLKEAMDKGYMEALIDVGAAFNTPGCGACLGAHQGVLAPGEICLTTGSRNFPGRMGSNKAEVYSVSPATGAASALTGKLTDPRQYI